MISCLTPTRGREERLRALVRRFQAQTHEDRELIILDDGAQPSVALGALGDPRVRYLYDPLRRSLGEKRNRLCAEARGELIAHFDDDDHYAPGYLARMAAGLGGADFVTLSSWFALHEKSGRVFHWDTARVLPWRFVVSARGISAEARAPADDPAHPEIELNLWGYGFSYLYRRSAWERAPFPAQDFGEDHAFAARLHALGLERRAVPDEEGLALHVLHGQNSSRIFPQFALPDFLARRLFPWASDVVR